MSKARTLADLVSTGGELADGQISVSEISDLTATAAELNTLDGITATVTELNTLDGATSSIQDQLDNISVTSGSLTKSFANGESASITLSSAISPAPVVSVTKEVAQTGVSSKGSWDVATDGSNYELHDTAYDTTLTPGSIEDFANASYDNISFDVTSQETGPTGVVFNSDGTKMFICGQGDDEVNEYTLSTAYDISTASFSTNFSVSAQETDPQDLAFNSDGTKMYIVGSSGDDVNQYILSTAFDISTASFDTNFSVSGQETTPVGITFNNDGTKMYIIGASGDDVNQYTLSTAFDVSTASFDSVTFSVSSEETVPTALTFNNDGTKMYITGRSGDDVTEYTLATAFDISTASFDGVVFSVSSEETSPVGIVFNGDGTKMYMVGETNDTVYQYSTATTANINKMNSTQLDAVTDPNHYTLGDTLDLAIMLYTADAGSIPESDGVTINYDAEALNQGAVLGTDYDYDFPDSTTVRVTSNAAQNLKIRVV